MQKNKELENVKNLKDQESKYWENQAFLAKNYNVQLKQAI